MTDHNRQVVGCLQLFIAALKWQTILSDWQESFASASASISWSRQVGQTLKGLIEWRSSSTIIGE